MNKELLKEWLVEYRKDVLEELKNAGFGYEKRKIQLNILFNKIVNNQIKSLEELNLLTSGISENLKFETDTIEQYINKLQHLLNKNIPVEIRINKVLDKSEYQISNFDDKVINNFIFFNEEYTYFSTPIYAQPFIDALGIENLILEKAKNNSYGELFKAFNDVVREHMVELCSEIWYNKKSAVLKKEDLYYSGISLNNEIGLFILIVANKRKFINHGFIDKIDIQKFYSISKTKFQLKQLRDKKIIFFLGENGTGKTVLLKGLLIALKRYFIEHSASREDTGIVNQVLSDNKDVNSFILTYKEQYEIRYFLNKKGFNNFYLKNCYAYGTQRNNISETKKAEKYGFLTLFKPDEFITNVEFWLQDLRFQELDGFDTIKVKDFENILGDLLDVQNLELTVNSREVKFKINNQKKSFKELSEGYQSVINLVTDLIARLVENNDIKNIADLKATQAVVLIDELDLFLHPKWEKNICGKLHEKFPNIQFFITTHSPILVDGAVKDKRINNEEIVIYKLGLENGATVIEGEPYTGDLIEDWTPNLLINSKLFDDHYFEDLDDEQIKELRSGNSEAELLKIGKSLKVLKNRSVELKERYLQELKNA